MVTHDCVNLGKINRIDMVECEIRQLGPYLKRNSNRVTRILRINNHFDIKCTYLSFYTVYDVGPALVKHWVDWSCLLGYLMQEQRPVTVHLKSEQLLLFTVNQHVKPLTLNKCCFDAGPSSATLAQQ